MSSTKRKREAVKPPSEDEWNHRKELLRGLYFNSTLPKLMVHMKKDYGFLASKNQYERKFKEWNFRKNLTVEEREHILRKKRKRDEAGKETRVILYGVEIPNKRLKKEESRIALSDLDRIFSSHATAPSPEGVSMSTPAPAIVNYPLRKVQIDNLPSLTLENLFASHFRSSQFSFSRGDSQQTTRNPLLGNPLFIQPSPVTPSISVGLIGYILESSTEVSTFSDAKGHQTLLQNLRNATLEGYEGEAEERIARLFGTSHVDALQEFLTFVAQFGSNNMLSPQQEWKILDWLSGQSKGFLESVFELQEAAVQACLQNLLHSAERVGNKYAFKVLVGADKRQSLYRGRREYLLHSAVKSNLPDLVRTLLREGIDVNIRVNEHTLLGAASTTEVAKMLIDAGADLDTPIAKFSSYAPIYYAACEGNANLFQLFLDEGALFDTSAFHLEMENRPASILACAIERASLDVVKILLEQGVECVDALRGFWDKLNYWGTQRSELQQACNMGETEIVRAILDTNSGKNVLRNGRYRWTPLRDAAMQGYLDIVDLLIDAGADVNGTSRDDGIPHDEFQLTPSTALMAAVEGGHINVVERLLDHRADFNATAAGKHGTNSLAVAELLGHHEIASLLRNAGASPLEADPHKLIIDIQFAASQNDLRRVQQILVLGVDVSNILDCPQAVYEKAGEHSKANVLSAFVAFCGYEANARGPRTGLCAIELAIDMGDVTIIRKLADAGADFSRTTSRGELFLQRALDGFNKRKIELAYVLLDYGAEVNPAEINKVRKPLEIAVSIGSIELVRVLLDRGADINARTRDWRGKTALQTAVQTAVSTGSVELVRLLLDRGADINAPARDWRGKTALQIAVSTGYVELVRLLLDRGADINAPGAELMCETALQTAMDSHSSTEMIYLLLDRGADINAPAARNSGRTALQATIDNRGRTPSHEHIQILIDNDADINAPPAETGGVTALQAAAIWGHLKIGLMLLELGADPNATGSLEDGRTALEGAAEHGRHDMAQLLLNAGAEPSQSAVDFAEEQEHFVIADMIKAALNMSGGNDRGKEREVESDSESWEGQETGQTQEER
ncbi:ankyrin repeat-containing domain protein [Rhexocercosporidium sp. MPI-PUGE-AT-0058]|nr:ankyrin repeat-containing domain protein [Rhexocercosporidium sp. MPI-PUGE-AT-0058]